MALTIIEEIQIINGIYRPKNVTLAEMIQQAAIGESDNFYVNLKKVDDSTHPLAYSYRNKMLSFVSLLVQETNEYTRKLTRIIVSNLAELPEITITNINNATDNEWIGFIENGMLQSIEVLAGITPEERSEYNSIE